MQMQHFRLSNNVYVNACNVKKPLYVGMAAKKRTKMAGFYVRFGCNAGLACFLCH